MPLNVKKAIPIILFFFSIVILGYYTSREETLQVLLLFMLMFGCYWALVKSNLSVKWIIFSGIILRLAQLLMLPNLSDDYFRFIWDGQLILNDINPFYRLPSYYMELTERPTGLTQYLYNNLNSPDYYTVYPPICQFTFWIAALIGKQSILLNVVIMRVFIILAEIGTLFIIPQILKKLKIDTSKLKWYAYNPLVIVELTGNLHYEGLMIFFISLAIYLILNHKTILSALVFSCAISTKLLPLMFLPILFSYLGWRKTLIFYFFTAVGIFTLFIWFIDFDMIQNMGESVNLYFKRFEFNASIYYIVRWIGFQVKGYNIIGTAGVRLTFVPIILISLLSIFKSNDLQLVIIKMLFAMSVYFFTATIIHPWYITTLVFLALFTDFKYTLFWSGLSLLSYATYRDTSYEEVTLFLFIEYTIVYTALFYELYKHKPLKDFFSGLTETVLKKITANK